jgi:hypothetical protein
MRAAHTPTSSELTSLQRVIVPILAIYEEYPELGITWIALPYERAKVIPCLYKALKIFYLFE